MKASNREAAQLGGHAGSHTHPFRELLGGRSQNYYVGGFPTLQLRPHLPAAHPLYIVEYRICSKAGGSRRPPDPRTNPSLNPNPIRAFGAP